MTGQHSMNFPAVNAAGDVINLNGLIIQKKTYNFPGGANGPIDLDFPQPFPNQCWTCFAVNAQAGFSASDTVSCMAISRSQCRVFQNNLASAAMQIRIIAIGF